MTSKGKQNHIMLNIPKISLYSPSSTMKDLEQQNNLHSQLQLEENYVDNISIYSSENQLQLLEQKNQNAQKKMKLKDYLFMTKISSSKKAQRKRKLLAQICEQPQKYQNNSLSSQSQSQLKRQKYFMEKNELLQILKNQVRHQLQGNIKQLHQLNNIIANIDVQNPSHNKMMIMYELRSLIKEQLDGVVQKMKKILTNQLNRDDEVQKQNMFDYAPMRYHQKQKTIQHKAIVHFVDQS